MSELSLKHAVEILRKPLMEDAMPTDDMLRVFVTMIELDNQEWLKVPNNDSKTQRSVDFLLRIAKDDGWFSMCCDKGLLPDYYKAWPNHLTFPASSSPETTPVKSIYTISGGAFEQNRRKH